MSEDHATYKHRPRSEGGEDIQHISEILDQLIEEQDWTDRLAQANNGHVRTKHAGRRRG